MSLSAKKNENSDNSESKNLKSTSLNLSEVNVNKTFKNILRNSDANNVYKEHKRIPFRERESKIKTDTNVFDDKYKFHPPTDKINQKFHNQYVKGNLRSTIVFDGGIKSTTDNWEKSSHVRRIIHKNLETNNQLNKSENFIHSPHTKNSLTTSRLLSDVYCKNPIEVLSKDQSAQLNNQIHQKTISKFNRVSNYLGSDGFKNSNLIHKNDMKPAYDKITNIHIDINRSATMADVPRHTIKKFNRVYEGGRVYYD